MLGRFVAAAGLLLLLSGCVTVQNTLAPAEIQSFRISEVRVSVAPGAHIQWLDATRSYLAEKKIPDDQLDAVSTSEEFKGWRQGNLQARVKAAFEQQLSNALIGTRPVRIEVTIHSLEISSAFQRIVIGGGYGISGDVTLVDAKTGSVIVSYPKLVYVRVAGQGIGGSIVQAAYDASNPPVDKLTVGLAETYRDWLLKK